MSISTVRAIRSGMSISRSHFLSGSSISVHHSHQSSAKMIHTDSTGDDHLSYTKQQDFLSAYPTFNLNPDQIGENDRPSGPRQGDEAILTLSGGVDSSMAAYLAITKGGLMPHRTIFMRNWNSLEESESFEPGAGGAEGCQWLRDWHRVEAMAKWLNVKPELMDLSNSYWNSVFAPALDDWRIGRTPNPDIACNREIKFGELLRQIDAEEQSIDTSFGRQKPRRWLVTGHYAHVDYFYPQQESVLHGKLIRSKDANKDQSYFLSGVSSLHLGRSHFPLANVEKDDVRAMARSLGIPTAESEESMGLCFVGKRNKSQIDRPLASSLEKSTGPIATQLGFAGFLGEYLDKKPGPILTLEGKKIGSHSGLHTLTVGQRARVGGAQQKYFVAAKDVERNCLIVVPGANHSMLQCTRLNIDDFSIISSSTFDPTGTLYAQIRHRQDPVACHVDRIGDGVRVHFDQPVSSVAEGQVCALYDANNRECLGSGVITAIETLASTAIS